MKDLILALARRGKTVILSSHLLADVEDVCDRVVIYYGGKIQAMGTLEGIAGHARRDSHHDAGVAARDDGARAGNHPQGRGHGQKIKIDNPTQNLESYFLDVVQKARKAMEETSGATSGHRVAAYLRGETEAKPSTDKILERLTLPTAAGKETATPTQSVETVDTQKLNALTKPTEPGVPTPTAEPAKPVDLSKANEKLSSLLGKPK